jgi:hypothetical protein
VRETVLVKFRRFMKSLDAISGAQRNPEPARVCVGREALGVRRPARDSSELSAAFTSFGRETKSADQSAHSKTWRQVPRFIGNETRSDGPREFSLCLTQCVKARIDPLEPVDVSALLQVPVVNACRIPATGTCKVSLPRIALCFAQQSPLTKRQGVKMTSVPMNR